MTNTNMPPLNVLLVDSDREYAEVLRRGIEQANCTVRARFDGGSGLQQATKHAFDVILLGVMLPVLNGFEVTKRLRLLCIHTPILLLAAQAIPEDAVKALDAGADDYLPRHLGLECVLAHIRARTRSVLRKSSAHLRFADLFLDPEKHQAVRAGQQLELTRTEFFILERLMNAAGRVVKRDQIIESVWGERNISGNILNVFIGFLRAKVDRPGLPRLLHTERGVGYSIRESVY